MSKQSNEVWMKVRIDKKLKEDLKVLAWIDGVRLLDKINRALFNVVAGRGKELEEARQLKKPIKSENY